jgi:hypothetical protein
MEAGRWTTSPKHLDPNQIVVSAVGDFIPGPSNCDLSGHVIRAVGESYFLFFSLFQ